MKFEEGMFAVLKEPIEFMGKIIENGSKGRVYCVSKNYAEDAPCVAVNFGRQRIAWVCPKNLTVYKKLITVSTDGVNTFASGFSDGKLYCGEARCHEDDEFDFVIGAKLAIKRLLAEMNKPNIIYACRLREGYHLTVSKVYAIKDGIYLNDNNEPVKFVNSDDWCIGDFDHVIIAMRTKRSTFFEVGQSYYIINGKAIDHSYKMHEYNPECWQVLMDNCAPDKK